MPVAFQHLLIESVFTGFFQAGNGVTGKLYDIVFLLPEMDIHGG